MHRTDETFLLHVGLWQANGRSLCEEEKGLYDALVSLKQLRHQTAHAGFLPGHDAAKSAHLTCCKVVQWLAGVAGFPHNDLMPPKEDRMPAISAVSRDAFAASPHQLAMIAELLGLSEKSSCGPGDHGPH